MNSIARWTTPSITYNPSAVEISDVNEIYLVIKQDGVEVLRKDITDATVTEDGFTWSFEQTETAKLRAAKCTVQIDYTSGTARYTTNPKQYMITDSAINEVI